MDKSLKQRLAGATILVALVVILVPEILRGRGTESQTPTAIPPRAVGSASTMDTSSAPMRSVTVDVSDSTTPSPSATPGQESTPMANAPASAASSISVTAPAATPEPPVPAASVAAPARRAAADLPKPAPKGPWVVQLGSFALRVSAERLVRELKADGYPAYVSPVTRGARELFRVRVGPMADRAAASAYYAALQESGKDAAIVSNR